MRRALPLAFVCLSLAAGSPGTLRFGAVPSGSDTKPVLLFLHGWNSSSEVWSVGNDMEAKATGAGYRTAFLDTYNDQSMWTNAPLIVNAAAQIQARFPGAHLVLIAHSKGGVDAQTALVYSGLKADALYTLGTPHRGTPLADLAWSGGAGWLAALIGLKNEGNRVLQTGYMASFRAQTDAKPESRATPLFTASGTKAGPFFSAYWWGGIAIGRTSDGVVPLDSSELPYEAGHLYTQSWNHGDLPNGTKSWPYIGASLASHSFLVPFRAEKAVPEPVLALDRLHRGGAIERSFAEFTFPVDAGHPVVELMLHSAGAMQQAIVISPRGHVSHLRFTGLDRNVLPGSRMSTGYLLAPESGLYRVRLMARNERDAYFFSARFPAEAMKGLTHSEVKDLREVKGLAQLRGDTAQAEISFDTRRIASPMRTFGPAEPAVLNHTTTLTWPGGRERTLIWSEAE
jgi:pimeloyl-ACP methyl ester carboxylesterase